MNTYKGFVIFTIIMISKYVDSEVPRLCDALLLVLMNKIPCNEIKVYREGKRLTDSELIGYIIKPTKSCQLKEGILYIEI